MSSVHDKAVAALKEIKRLEAFPLISGYHAAGSGIYAEGYPQPLIRDGAAPRETVNLIVEALNWRVKKKLLMEIVEEGLSE